MSDQSQNPFSQSGGYSQTVTLNGDSAPQAADIIKDTTTANFTKDVIQASREVPVLVDFWAPWCGPCKQLTPVIEKLVTAARGMVRLVKMNIDEHPGIAGQLGIQSIPAVIAFRNGQPVDGFMGAVPESQIKSFIDKLTAGAPGSVGDLIAQAQDAKANGDASLAADIFAAILEQEPDNVDALAGLAEIYLDAGQDDQAKALIADVPQDKAGHPGIAALNARFALSEQTSGLGDAAGLEAKLAADPNDHQARFDLALIANAKGDRDTAADQLLAIIKTDREWRDDGARAQLLQFFEAWGMTDPATLSARRKLSSLLFR